MGNFFWILIRGSVFGFWDVFWILGSVLGFWDVFWILESVLSLQATVLEIIRHLINKNKKIFLSLS